METSDGDNNNHIIKAHCESKIGDFLAQKQEIKAAVSKREP